jgi:Tol biopolymer transport system component
MSNNFRLIFLILSGSLFSSQAFCEQRTAAVVYTKFTDSGAEVWLVGVDGEDNRMIGSGADATWSPDGNKLAFVMEVDGNTDIYTMGVDGKNVVRLTSDPAEEHSPTWSPDGSMIAFNSSRSGSDQIWRSNVDAGSWGYNLTQLTKDTHHNRVNNFISWSPDGRWIAFEADRDRDDPEIYLANSVDGSNQQRLTFTRALDEVPSWSPAGNEILFSSDMHDSPQSGTYDIYIMSVDGSNQRRLTTTAGAASYPSMSIDGKKIVYSYQTGEDDAGDIMIMNADGSDARVLIEGGSIPRFSPF